MQVESAVVCVGGGGWKRAQQDEEDTEEDGLDGVEQEDKDSLVSSELRLWLLYSLSRTKLGPIADSCT